MGHRPDMASTHQRAADGHFQRSIHPAQSAIAPAISSRAINAILNDTPAMAQRPHLSHSMLGTSSLPTRSRKMMAPSRACYYPSRGTHDDQNQGCARRGGRYLCRTKRHGAPACPSRTHPPGDLSVWLRQCLPRWQRVPMVPRSRIRADPPGLHSRLELRNGRRWRPIPSMRDGGRLTHDQIEIGSPPFTRHRASRFARDSGAAAQPSR
jgi:hypothetical protein